MANADPLSYSPEYKKWLLMNTEGQMQSYELGWGWFYWTWITEDSTQWSWKLAMDAGTAPKKVWERNYNCSTEAPDFSGLSESYRF